MFLKVVEMGIDGQSSEKLKVISEKSGKVKSELGKVPQRSGGDCNFFKTIE
jgi:hypothetical protein